METARHLLVLCCYGGQPFVDFHPKLRPATTRSLDPTDWIATDIAGTLLNASLSSSFLHSHPSIRSVVESGVSIESCDLFNLTFTNLADEHLFESYKADLACRCSPSREGVACEREAAASLALSSASSVSVAPAYSSAPMLLLVVAVIFALLIVVFMAMRGCFCDCFGPWRNSCARDEDDEDNKPVDRASVEHALNAVREYEARRYGEQSQPLMIPSVSEGCAAPYNTTVIPPPPPTRNPYFGRPPSPPPSYSSLAGSRDRLPSASS